MLLTAPFAHGLQTGDASNMVGIITLVCPGDCLKYTRAPRRWRTFLSCNVLSVPVSYGRPCSRRAPRHQDDSRRYV